MNSEEFDACVKGGILECLFVGCGIMISGINVPAAGMTIVIGSLFALDYTYRVFSNSKKNKAIIEKPKVVCEHHTNYTGREDQEVYTIEEKQINDFEEEIDILDRFEMLFCYDKYGWADTRRYRYPKDECEKQFNTIENIINILEMQKKTKDKMDWFFLNEHLFSDINAYLELTERIDGKFMNNEVAKTYALLKDKLVNEIICWHDIMMDSKHKMEEAETKYLIEGFATIYKEHAQKRNYLPLTTKD